MEDRERYKTGERAIAPIVATVIPALIVTVLMVVTAISSRPHERHEWDIARPVEDDLITPIDNDPPPDPPREDIQLTDETPDITVDTAVPQVKTISLIPQPVAQPAEPVTVKPAPADTVQNIKSVIVMSGIPRSRTPGARRRVTGGGVNNGDGTTEAAVMKALHRISLTLIPLEALT